MPLWSELNSILSSIYGRAATIIALASPLTYLFFLPDHILATARIMTAGAIMILASNFLFIARVPVLQRNYTSYSQYEEKCLLLAGDESLDLNEEFGQISGKKIDEQQWNRSGLSFPYLAGESYIPAIDDYKAHFSRTSHEGEILNRKKLVRSLSAIKYVYFDSAMLRTRKIVSLLLLSGITFIYGPPMIRILFWVARPLGN